MLSSAADYNPNTRHTETKNKNRVSSLFGLLLNAKKRERKKRKSKKIQEAQEEHTTTLTTDVKHEVTDYTQT